MSAPIQPTETEYGRKLREWQMRLAEFMDLDPAALLDIDHEVGDDGWDRVEWRAIKRLEPRVGKVEQWGLAGVGEDDGTITFSAVVILDRADGDALLENVGPKPELLTAEKRAMLERLQ